MGHTAWMSLVDLIPILNSLIFGGARCSHSTRSSTVTTYPSFLASLAFQQGTWKGLV